MTKYTPKRGSIGQSSPEKVSLHRPHITVRESMTPQPTGKNQPNDSTPHGPEAARCTRTVVCRFEPRRDQQWMWRTMEARADRIPFASATTSKPVFVRGTRCSNTEIVICTFRQRTNLGNTLPSIAERCRGRCPRRGEKDQHHLIRIHATIDGSAHRHNGCPPILDNRMHWVYLI